MKSVPRRSFNLLETSTKTRFVFPGTIYVVRIDLINLEGPEWLNELGRWMQQLKTNSKRTTYHGQATGELYHLPLRVECILLVIYNGRREPMPYWWYACMCCCIQRPNSLSHSGPSRLMRSIRTTYIVLNLSFTMSHV
jgi:hypothetical protein